MSRPPKYTKEDDALINRMWFEGTGWEAIGAVFNTTGYAISQRARRQSLECWKAHIAALNAPPPPPPEMPARVQAGPGPLPFMHPITWGVLVSITPAIASAGAR